MNEGEKIIDEKERDFENIFRFHPPKEGQAERYQMIRNHMKHLAELINNICPRSRERSIAFTKLEEASMWANTAIARNE